MKDPRLPLRASSAVTAQWLPGIDDDDLLQRVADHWAPGSARVAVVVAGAVRRHSCLVVITVAVVQAGVAPVTAIGGM